MKFFGRDKVLYLSTSLYSLYYLLVEYSEIASPFLRAHILARAKRDAMSFYCIYKTVVFLDVKTLVGLHKDFV